MEIHVSTDKHIPNDARLAGANLINPRSQTPFGVNGRISMTDFQELLPQQQSFPIEPQHAGDIGDTRPGIPCRLEAHAHPVGVRGGVPGYNQRLESHDG